MLVARVGGRIEQSKERKTSERDPPYALGADEKLAALLNMT
jgi:hypothetical protein